MNNITIPANLTGKMARQSTGNVLEDLDFSPVDVFGKVAAQTQDHPLRIEVTIRLQDLTPVAVISGLALVAIFVVPFLIYRLRVGPK